MHTTRPHPCDDPTDGKSLGGQARPQGIFHSCKNMHGSEDSHRSIITNICSMIARVSYILIHICRSIANRSSIIMDNSQSVAKTSIYVFSNTRTDVYNNAVLVCIELQMSIYVAFHNCNHITDVRDNASCIVSKIGKNTIMRSTLAVRSQKFAEGGFVRVC